MSYAYNSQSIGDEITASKFNAVTEAEGRITDVELYPIKAARYIVYKIGSTYYRWDGLDGIVDDSNADAYTLIQAAVTAVGTAGGKVLIKAQSGDYELSDTLDLSGTRGLILEGEGRTYNGNMSSLVLADSVDKTLIKQVESFPPQVQCGTEIRGLRLSGNKTGQTSTTIDVLYLENVFHALIENNVIWGAKRYGTYVKTSELVTIKNNFIEGNANYQVFDESSNYSVYSHNFIDGFDTEPGIYFSAGQENKVIANTIDRCVDYGVRLTGADCKFNTIAHNTILGDGTTAGSIGVSIATSANRNDISFNKIRNFVASGVSLASTNNTVIGNTIFDDQTPKTQEYGVKEAAGADYNIIQGNHLRGNKLGGLVLIGQHNILDESPISVEMDLSAAAEDFPVWNATAPCEVNGYLVFWTEAAGDANTCTIRVGEVEDDATIDTDQFDSYVTAGNETLGTNTFVASAAMTDMIVDSDHLITVGHTQKTGAGKVIIKLYLSNMSDIA